MTNYERIIQELNDAPVDALATFLFYHTRSSPCSHCSFWNEDYCRAKIEDVGLNTKYIASMDYVCRTGIKNWLEDEHDES
jgi:hypothetical protein